MKVFVLKEEREANQGSVPGRRDDGRDRQRQRHIGRNIDIPHLGPADNRGKCSSQSEAPDEAPAALKARKDRPVAWPQLAVLMDHPASGSRDSRGGDGVTPTSSCRSRTPRKDRSLEWLSTGLALTLGESLLGFGAGDRRGSAARGNGIPTALNLS